MVTYFKKYKNHLSAIIVPMLKTDFMNAVSESEYTVNDVHRANFINVETHFINAEK